MCLGRIILAFIATVTLLGVSNTFAQQTQPATEYQEYLRAWEQQQQAWNQAWAEQRSEAQRARWYVGGFLVVVLALCGASVVASRRRYKQSAAKYDAYLEALRKREDKLLKTLEAIERRLGGGT